MRVMVDCSPCKFLLFKYNLPFLYYNVNKFFIAQKKNKKAFNFRMQVGF